MSLVRKLASVLKNPENLVKNPHYIPRELNRLWHGRFGRRQFNPDGIDVTEADWDQLVILDACRYDVFSEHVDLPGETESRISRAGTTTEWLRANFDGKELHDTIYITTNTWIFMLDDLEVEFFSTVHAESDEEAVETAVEQYRQYEDKRFIIHLVSPHHPYVGPTAERCLPETQSDELFDRIKRGEVEISDSDLRRAYVETLNSVIPLVYDVLDEFAGRTVVSADHGELLGDWVSPIPMRDYGHYSSLYVSPLVLVPWHVHETDSRRMIREAKPLSESKEPGEEEVKNRLRQLGYR